MQFSMQQDIHTLNIILNSFIDLLSVLGKVMEVAEQRALITSTEKYAPVNCLRTAIALVRTVSEKVLIWIWNIKILMIPSPFQ